MRLRYLLGCWCLYVAMGGLCLGDLPLASPEALPRWRGFNLLEKFMLDRGRQPFREEDFRLIRSLGFNFVRLPMDYRFWIKDGDWTRFDETVLAEIDQAVAWGEKYGLHVCINFHRAPGYTVAHPPEPTDLWTDPETQRVCALHWAVFAHRYKGISNARLSFNLLNEPGPVDGAVYARVAGILVDAIRAEDPDRLILADGLRWGTRPCPELVPLRLAQMTRGYAPMEITHYKARWVNGWEKMGRPSWPMPVTCSFLYGPGHKDGHRPLRLEGEKTGPGTLRLRIGTVSASAHLAVKADGRIIGERTFVCRGGAGEWKEAVFKPEWNIYQNRYDLDWHVDLPAEWRRVDVLAVKGDWLTIPEIGLTPFGATEAVLSLMEQWGTPASTIRVMDWGKQMRFEGVECRDRAWLQGEYIEPWRQLQTQARVGVMVGEWGAFHHTPHAVVLSWMEDCLANWKEAGWGWALWNFRGPFGVLDSERVDVDYEEWRGHKLDRAMLQLLQRY